MSTIEISTLQFPTEKQNIVLWIASCISNFFNVENDENDDM
jgi:hypothetical protein